MGLLSTRRAFSLRSHKLTFCLTTLCHPPHSPSPLPKPPQLPDQPPPPPLPPKVGTRISSFGFDVLPLCFVCCVCMCSNPRPNAQSRGRVGRGKVSEGERDGTETSTVLWYRCFCHWVLVQFRLARESESHTCNAFGGSKRSGLSSRSPYPGLSLPPSPLLLRLCPLPPLPLPPSALLPLWSSSAGHVASSAITRSHKGGSATRITDATAASADAADAASSPARTGQGGRGG